MAFWCNVLNHKWKTIYRKKLNGLVYTIQKCTRCSEEMSQSHTGNDIYGRTYIDIEWAKAHMTEEDRTTQSYPMDSNS